MDITGINAVSVRCNGFLKRPTAEGLARPPHVSIAGLHGGLDRMEGIAAFLHGRFSASKIFKAFGSAAALLDTVTAIENAARPIFYKKRPEVSLKSEIASIICLTVTNL